MSILSVAAAGMGAMAVSYLILGSRRADRIAGRIASIEAAKVLPRDARLAAPFITRATRPLLTLLEGLGTRLTPAGARAALDARLAMAGSYGDAARKALMVSQALSWALGLAAGWLASQQRPALGIVFGAAVVIVGQLLPRLFLNQRIRARREAITRDLPDVLDQVTASVEAGLGFDSAILRVTARKTRRTTALLEELSRYLTDVRLGRARPDALRDLSERSGVADLSGVTGALIQADQLGVGVSPVLRTQSQHLRIRRRQRAQASALQAPVKMLFPLVFFIFPAIFVVTLGPAALRLLDTFAQVK